MKKIENFIIRKWFWLSIGLVLTRFAVERCYEQRGWFYIGGEWFIIPAIILASNIVPSIVCQIVNVFSKEV